MRYEVRITPYALEQIRSTITYISKVLLEPDVAISWSNRLEKEISGLDDMPSRFPLVEKEP